MFGETDASPIRPMKVTDPEPFDPPGTPDHKDQRRRTLRIADDHLRDRGRADRSELVDEVFPTAPGADEEPSHG